MYTAAFCMECLHLNSIAIDLDSGAVLKTLYVGSVDAPIGDLYWV